MTKASDKIDALLTETQEKCFAIYVEDARRVLRACPRLSYLVAAMGTAFWVDKHGGSLGDDDHGISATARDFLTETDATYYEAFRSPGVQIHHDKVVTSW